MNTIIIPADVPQNMQQEFMRNYKKITEQSDHLFLFSCDQKIEHLHDDFNQNKTATSAESIDPEHFFKIASQGRVGALATQLELIARYASAYKTVNYIAKLNSKTNLVTTKIQDPRSAPLWDVDDVMRVKQESGLSICGIGVTIYPGSIYEDTMMSFAARMIIEAHKHGLIAILWMYPRGKAVVQEDDPDLLAGVAGAANALGADFVKIKSPAPTPQKNSLESLQEIVTAAGNTKVLISGGEKIDIEQFLRTLYEQLHTGNVAGTAVGRNVFQHSLAKAICITEAISLLVYDNAPLKKALEYIR